MHPPILWAIPFAADNQIAWSTLQRFLVSGVVVFATAVLLGMVLTAVVRFAATKFGLVDQPDNHRKLHGRPIPLGGGLAVFAAVSLVVAGLLTFPNPWHFYLSEHAREIGVLFAAGVVIVAVGLVDDRYRLQGRVKLLGQLLAASVLVFGGLVIDRFGAFQSEWEINLGFFAIPISLFWFVGAINSVNLLDGIDGLATTLGFILTSTIAAIGAISGQPHITVLALVFAGGLLGFLRFNYPPASVFLGDAGSMLIGLVVGALAILGSLKGPGTVLLAAPLAIWTLPIMDSVAAIIRRKMTGRSIYATDRGHLHHRLLQVLGSNQRVLACVALVCVITCAAALVSVALKADLIAILACLAVVAMLVATGMFGKVEFSLLLNRVKEWGGGLVKPTERKNGRIRQREIRLQGSRPWEFLFATLTESAEKLGLSEIRLNVNQPQAQEGYHAFWQCDLPDDVEHRWRLEIPLFTAGCSIGHLTIAGPFAGGSACDYIEGLLTLLEPFEERLRTLTGLEEGSVSLPRIGETPSAENDPCEATATSPISQRKHPR